MIILKKLSYHSLLIFGATFAISLFSMSAGIAQAAPDITISSSPTSGNIMFSLGTYSVTDANPANIQISDIVSALDFNNVTITTSGTITLDAAATLTSSSENQLTLNSGTGQSLLGTISLSLGKLTLQNSISGNITQSSAISVGGLTTLSNSGDIILTNVSNNFSTVAVSSGSNVSLSDTNALILGASTVNNNLTLAVGGNITQSGTWTITENLLATLNGFKIDFADSLSAANALYLNSILQVPGTWGSTSSSALNKSDVYFSGTGSIAIATGATRVLTVTGITASNKVYDGSTSATLNTSSAALVGVVPGDTVNLVTASATGSFSSKTIGNGKTVTVSGLTISGADAGKYAVTQPTTTADITAKALTVTGITASNKVYDGSTSATLNTSSAALVGVVPGDTLSLNVASAIGTFDTAAVGTGKAVGISGLTISGSDSSNYFLVQPTVIANIAAAVSGGQSDRKVMPDQPELILVNRVINDDGGKALSVDFEIHIKIYGHDVSGSPVPRYQLPEKIYQLDDIGVFQVSEVPLLGYAVSFSGDCDSEGRINLDYFDKKTCIVTNNDIRSVYVPLPILEPVYPVNPATPSVQALEHASEVAQTVSPAFNKDLAFGNRSDDVSRLQQLLAVDKNIYPEGLITGYFGPLTQKAVKAFQKKHGLDQVGRVGPLTRAKLQEVFGASAVPMNQSVETMESLQALITSLQNQIQELVRKK